ncbi:NB-ARC domains-containing protein [Artemisia annua]|uniref:NB-ARC domains-containing protein n=1 Tax=Artemisia annua TaxID=35608 RepID=A0A2U1L1V0_ARTAN|nr:NB-ARC domains-containing protein [Artemisia annua]
MAEVVAGIVNDVLGRLSAAAMEEISLLWGFKDDILALEVDLSRLKAFLQDAEEKHSKVRSVALWVGSLRHLSLKIENLLDDVLTEAMLKKLRKELGYKSKVKAFFSYDHNKVVFRTRIGHRIKTIRSKLAEISAKTSELNLNAGVDVMLSSVDVRAESSEIRAASSRLDTPIIIERTEEMDKIVGTLCNDVDKFDKVDDEVPVYAIYGMGGLGKTTIARLVYDHKKVNKRFEIKCWIHVSQTFNVEEILHTVIESVDPSKSCRSFHLDAMQNCVENLLEGKRFLIVMDDVWIERSERKNWTTLSKSLSVGAQGSIVVITTRSMETSVMMAKVPELQLQLGAFSEEKSWLLFKTLAFPQNIVPDELEPIGKMIVEKCDGLPLALESLGSLMSSKSRLSTWERVLHSNMWELDTNEILPALMLSYDYLLPHVQRCFAYCCMFPKGSMFKKDSLIVFWMANSLIDLYEDGEDVFNCLLWRFFIYKSRVVGEYIMHDLVHDLAHYLMRHDCAIIENGKDIRIPDGVIHLSSISPEFMLSLDFKQSKYLRSMLIFNNGSNGNIKRIFDHVYLRVLFCFSTDLKAFPDSVSKLKHLKCLNLSGSTIEVLPESMMYLQNLLYLILQFCHKLRKLPQGLSYMRKLQHLDISNCFSLDHLPLGIKELIFLRRLSHFPVGKDSGAQLEELGDLNRLEGELALCKLENCKGNQVKSAKLRLKRNLQVLTLVWSNRYMFGQEFVEHSNDEMVVEGLEPNPSLKELTVRFYMGKIMRGSWVVKLTNLVKIKFDFCYYLEQIPPLGKLPNLKEIELHVLQDLKGFHDDDNSMSREDGMFPSLQVLYIDGTKLESLPGYFPKLRVMEIKRCHCLGSLPANIQSMRDLEFLHIESCENLAKRYEKDIGEDWHKISHIGRIIVKPPRASSLDDSQGGRRETMAEKGSSSKAAGGEDDEGSSMMEGGLSSLAVQRNANVKICEIEEIEENRH